MPLTAFQARLLAVLAQARTDDRYLAGAAALHIEPNSIRYSHDLDFFHDAEERVATTFTDDQATLQAAGYTVTVTLSQPGFIRATVESPDGATRVDWAHDTAWRFLPLVRDPAGGLLLHPIDLAVNKVLALAGRDEPRDFVDILDIHARILPLAGLCWAAPGKDPGFTPLSLLELLRRRGRPRPEDIARLDLAVPFDLVASKTTWLAALDASERFARSRPPEEVGCLYYAPALGRFIVPEVDSQGEVIPHYGAPGGVVPRVPA